MRTMLVIAVLAALAIAAPASAAEYIGKRTAERYARDFWKHKQGFRYAAATCRPQGMRRFDRRRRYDRWACGFAAGMRRGKPSCTGGMLIIGARGKGRYLRRVDYQRGRCRSRR
jgi:hypothetical protein